VIFLEGTFKNRKLGLKKVPDGKITPCARLNDSVIQTLAKPDFSSSNHHF